MAGTTTPSQMIGVSTMSTAQPGMKVTALSTVHNESPIGNGKKVMLWT